MFDLTTKRQLGDIPYYIVYTVLAFLVLAAAYVAYTSYVFKPFLEPLLPIGSNGSRLVYALQGFILIILVEPTRLSIQKLVQLVQTGRHVQYTKLHDSITGTLTNQATVEEVSKAVSSAIKGAFSCSAVHVIARFEGKYYRVDADAIELEMSQHPILECFENNPELFIDFYHSTAHKQSPNMAKWMRANDVVYVLPLLVERQLLGWVEVIQHTNTRFIMSYADRMFFRDIQAKLAIGLRRTTLQRHLENRIEELVTLQHISHTMNSSLNVNETIDGVMDAVIELSGPDRALFYQKRADGLYPTISRGVDEDINLNFVIDIEKSIFKWILDKRQPLIVEDVTKDSRVNLEYAAMVKSKGFLAVPVVSQEKLLGIIAVDNLHSGRSVYTVNLPILVTLANNLSIALANSTLFEQTQEFNIQLQKEVDDATAHLKELLEMKSHFLTLASHQLRTPTTIVKGMLSMLEEDPDMPRDEQRKLIEHAFVSTSRLERIISELLSATALEDSSVEAIIEEFDLEKLIRDVARELQVLAEKKNLELSLEFGGNVQVARSDQYKLKEAITNLVDNALRYTQEGSVTVSAVCADGECNITVSDTGIGLTAEDTEYIFEKFQRGEHVSDIEPNGSGLGLFIAKRIVDVIGGTITVESEGQNAGATFAISFPLL